MFRNEQRIVRVEGVESLDKRRIDAEVVFWAMTRGTGATIAVERLRKKEPVAVGYLLIECCETRRARRRGVRRNWQRFSQAAPQHP